MKRETALHAVQAAAEAYDARSRGAEVPTLESFSADVAGRIAHKLREALEWARTTVEEQLTGESDDLEGMGDGDYVSHHPVIALAQTAMEEAPLAHEIRSIGQHILEFQLTPGPDLFVAHQSLDDFRFPLAAKCTVVLVGDWGTGKDRAKRVADVIRQVDPDHVIHLGDIYPSGTPARARKHFVDVWNQHGPKRAKYWAMNGNHEMNAKGVGYFGTVLPFCSQQASYFSLENAHWKLIALDTAYQARDLEPRQAPWLDARLKDGGARNILLTHHQMFSAVDPRPPTDHAKLIQAMQPFVASGRIFGWFWGHEHWMLSYARDPAFGGYLARAIGHGGKRIKDVAGQHNGHAPAVRHYWNRPHPTVPGRCLNGFAVLRFDGPQLVISYPDETGPLDLFTEIWPDQPH